jgi:hypothetical protein
LRERERDNYGTVDCGEGATRINGVDDTRHTIDHNFQDVSELKIFFHPLAKAHKHPSIHPSQSLQNPTPFFFISWTHRKYFRVV